MTNIISEAFEKFIEECLKNYEISPNFEKLVLIADSQTNGRFTPLIKIIKHWNGRIGDIMDPLFLEAVALCIFYKSPLKSKKPSQYPKFKRFDDFPKALKGFPTFSIFSFKLKTLSSPSVQPLLESFSCNIVCQFPT